MKYRYIPFKRYNPYFKTGLNKALIESVAESGEPIIFLAGWDRKCVNLGRSQSFEKEVNLEEFEEREDVVLVRRQGGGGATFLTPEGEITWGIIAPEEEFPEDINKIYSELCGDIASGLSDIGIDAQHEPVNDIVTEEGKISGSTVKRSQGVTYFGGTLLYSVDVEEMFSLLTPGDEKMRDKDIQDYRERVISISQLTDLSFEETKENLKDILLEGREFSLSELKDSEIKRAEELANKYSSQKWLYRE